MRNKRFIRIIFLLFSITFFLSSNNLIAQITKVIISPDATICRGSSLTLTASVSAGNPVLPLKYKWNTGASSEVITVNPTVQTSYTVTITDANGSSASDRAVIKMYNLPTASAGADKTICLGKSTTLRASGGTLYKWNTGATTSRLTVAPSQTTTYSVTVTNSNGCSVTDAAVVFVNPIPVANAGADKSICKGQSVILSASGGTKYKWSTGASTASITVKPTATKTYTVTVTNSSGCSSIDNVIVNVYNLPVANISANQSICLGSSATITASGGSSYIWSNGMSGSTIVVFPAVKTTYTVTISNAGGCTSSARTVVSILSNPIANAGSDVTTCSLSSINLTASGGATYKWNSGATTAINTVAPIITTTYSVTVTNSSGCTAKDEVIVYTNPLPIANAGGNKSICNGQSTTLIASGGVAYKWNTGQTSTQITVTPALTTTYTVTVTSSNGCTASSNAIVNIYTTPVVSISPVQSACFGSSVALTADGGSVYNWSNGMNGASIVVSPTVNTTYTVTVSNVGGCSSAASTSISMLPIPIANAGGDKIICLSESTTLSASGGNNYLWNTGFNGQNLNVTPNSTTLYTVTVTSSNGCSASDVAKVVVNHLLDFTKSNDTLINYGSSIQISVSGGQYYLWNNGSVLNSIVVAPKQPTYYAFTITSDFKCPAIDSIFVNINPLKAPDSLKVNRKSFCYTDQGTISLAAYGGSGYALRWYYMDYDRDGCGDVYIGSGNPLTIESPVHSTNYYARWADGENVYSFSPCKLISVPVIQRPKNPTFASVTPNCFNYITGDSITLYASGNTGKYVWYQGSTANPPIGIKQTLKIPAPSATTTYYVAHSNVCGVSSGRQIIAYHNAIPHEPLILHSNKDNFCYADTNLMRITAIGGCGDSLAWYTGGCGNTLIGKGNPLILPTPTTSTQYFARWENSNKFSVCDTIRIQVYKNASPVTAVDVELLSDSIKLSASGGTGTFYWFDNGCGSNLIGSSPEIIISKPTVSTTYSVTHKNACGLAACVSTVFNPILPRMMLDNVVEENVDLEFSKEDFLNNSMQLKIYPNPFNGSAEITFNLPVEGEVNIDVLDLFGRKISNIVNHETLTSGAHRLAMNKNLKPGIYLLRIQQKGIFIQKKFIVSE